MATPVSYTTLRGTRLRESEKAVLFEVHDISGAPLDKAHQSWFPISRISKSLHDPDKPETDIIVVESWLVDKFCEAHNI